MKPLANKLNSTSPLREPAGRPGRHQATNEGRRGRRNVRLDGSPRGSAPRELMDEIVMASSPSAPWRAAALQPPGARMPVVAGQSLEELPDDLFTTRLDEPLKRTLVAYALQQESSLWYSTMAMVLALSRRVRKSEQIHGLQMRYSEHLGSMPMSSAELIQHYGGATCFNLAESLVERLRQQHGLQGFALIAERAPMGMARWDSFTRPKGRTLIEDIAEHCAHLGHVDVVLPYMEQQRKRLLILPTGGVVNAQAQDISLSQYLDNRGGGRLLNNPGSLAFRALWGRCTVHLVSPDAKLVFGINFISNTMFLSGQSQKVVNFAMRCAVALPESMHLERAFDVSQLPPWATRPMTPDGQKLWDGCRLYLAGVSRVFKLPKEAKADLIFLLDRRKNYLEDVVHPLGKVLRDSYVARDQAMRHRYEASVLLQHRPSSVAQGLISHVDQFLRQAGRAVEKMDCEAATQAYRAAADCAKKAANIEERQLIEEHV